MSQLSPSALARLSIAASALTLSTGALAQSQEQGVDTQSLPADMQSAPIPEESYTTSVGEDGVETVVRTRRIERREPAPVYAPATYAPTASVVEREAWIEECDRRTNGRSEDDKGGIIGSLLGAITGGLIGNRVAGSGERLGGSLIGAGVGGLGGFLLGNLLGGGKKDDRYDCEAALDSYISQYGSAPTRIASRNIPAPAPVYTPYGYPPQGYYGYAPAAPYAPPQQVVYVPIRYEQQQRVIVRETVREE